jgi:hypothetical protein
MSAIAASHFFSHSPAAALIQGKDGNVYGTTVYGGAYQQRRGRPPGSRNRAQRADDYMNGPQDGDGAFGST